MCGGFTCSKNALTALNILYIMVGVILIVAVVYGRASAQVTNLPVVSGVLVCGLFLILVSILGLFGAVKHNQVILFFYMIILFLIFVVQFGIACACLAVDDQEQEQLAEEGWRTVGLEIKKEVQRELSCCGFDVKVHNATDPMGHPHCEHMNLCCSFDEHDCHCPPCKPQIQDAIEYALKLCGGISLFFSFTEFVGVWLTVRYRNQKDPRGNPSAFL